MTKKVRIAWSHGYKVAFEGETLVICLKRKKLTGERIVIDTKFNSVVTRGWYREETLWSGYIYQIYAYLRSQGGNGDPLAANASGLLLHPSVEGMVNESVVIQGHEIRFATVDLGGDAKEIRSQLLQVLEVPHVD